MKIVNNKEAVICQILNLDMKKEIQAGAELCQAQVKLEGIV